MSCQPALVDVSSLLLLSAGALEDVQRLEAQGLQRKGYSQDNLASARQAVGYVVGELQKVCKPQRLPDLSYLNTTEQQAILKALTTVTAVLVKLQDHKHLAASQEDLEKEEASTMPAAALADPLRWLQAQLQGGERFLGRVLADTTHTALAQQSLQEGVPEYLRSTSCQRYLSQGHMACMDAWEPLYHGALACYLACPALLLDGRHRAAVQILRQHATLALPSGQQADLCQLLGQHAAPAMRALLMKRSISDTERPAATARLEAAIRELQGAQPARPSFLHSLQRKAAGQAATQPKAAARKAVQLFKQPSCTTPTSARAISAVHGFAEPLLESCSASSAPVADAPHKKSIGLVARLIQAFTGNKNTRRQQAKPEPQTFVKPHSAAAELSFSAGPLQRVEPLSHVSSLLKPLQKSSPIKPARRQINLVVTAGPLISLQD